MNIPPSGIRQVFVYHQGRPHWSQNGPVFYDRRLNQQFPLGTPFPGQPVQANQWFRAPVFNGPPVCPRNIPVNFRVNITWNTPFYNNLTIQVVRPNSRGRRRNMIVGRRRPLTDNEEEQELCFICGDVLQNSNESGVHLCDGGEQREEAPSGSNDNHGNVNINAKLDTILENIKSSLKNDYQSVSESLEMYFSERINEINTIHQEVCRERDSLRELREDIVKKSAEIEQKQKELADLQQTLLKDKNKFDEDVKKEQEEMARRWQQLRDEITRMEEMHNIQKGRVKLDVGGHVYTTSMLTLTRDQDSMLAAMFSGRHPIKTEADGTVFIDRDGTHFRYILNFLRDGGLNAEALPRNKQTLRELRNEAVYFQLHGLAQQVEKLLG
ncbi:hypothetical protein SNE40_020780 [Patella caerulea]|uniref:BTB domain-containing protein n=1 Tax=Patella caerulea TaxID=87958 RepID=A0AAN8PBQ8_PATCE